MKKKRIIAKLDIKTNKLIKGIQFECLRVMGDPKERANIYYEGGADELLYIDTVASLYNRNFLSDLVSYTCEEINIPLTVGGGIRSVDDMEKLFKSGADKVAINSHAVKNPNLLSDAVKNFGSQSIISSIQAKKSKSSWEVYIDNGREPTNINVFDWIKKVQDKGVGEILLTSIDRDGTKKGYDYDLLEYIDKIIKVPLMFCGGAGNCDDVSNLLKIKKVDAAVIASILHYNTFDIKTIKDKVNSNGISIRKTKYKNKNIKNLDKKEDNDYNFYSLKNLENLKVKKSNYKRKRNNLIKKNLDVVIIDLGVSNIKSVYNSIRKLKKDVFIAEQSKDILNAKSIILPGVGSFYKASNNLKKLKISSTIVDKVNNGTPILGICLGMQLLLTRGYEGGNSAGLNLINGDVVKLPTEKVHMGWNHVNFNKTKILDNFNINDKKIDLDFYFVHTYQCMLEDKQYEAASTFYENISFCSMIEKDNILATQFHVEKSGENGLKLLDYFFSKQIK